MVAPVTPSSAASVGESVPQSLLTGRNGFVRFTADDVQIMLRQGILPEDSTTELLNGLVIHKDRGDLGGEPLLLGPKHRACIRRLTALVSRIDTPARHAQVQLPIVCGIDQMPEPDFAVIRGPDSDYTDRLPTAADTFMVLEAADSSLERDRDEKLPVYAAAGIQQYVILDLRTRTAMIYANPDRAAGTYPPPTIVREGEELWLRVGEDEIFTIPLADLLP